MTEVTAVSFQLVLILIKRVKLHLSSKYCLWLSVVRINKRDFVFDVELTEVLFSAGKRISMEMVNGTSRRRPFQYYEDKIYGMGDSIF